MSGFVGDLSPKQEEALRKFKAAVEEVPGKPEDSDHYYLRWLRARKFDVRKTEDMFRKHIEWRKVMGSDTILEDYTPPEVLAKFAPGGFFGEDREGHPVWYDSIGNLDFKGFHRSCTLDEVLKYKAHEREVMVKTLEEFSQKKGRLIETITVVLDFENMSVERHYYWPGIDSMRAVLRQVEGNTPECMKHVFVLKAPSFFPVAYGLVKGFLDEKTRRKIHVLGRNWPEELQKYIHPDQLPQAFGGNRCEPDPQCTAYLNPGYDVPEQYYRTNLTTISRDKMEKVVVGNRSHHKLRVDVHETESVLVWEFLTTSFDISFGVYYKDSSRQAKKEELVPMERKQSHIIPEQGCHLCKRTGTYVLKFDNSYSWTRSKEIFYSVQVESPSPPTPEGDRHDNAECEEGATGTSKLS